MLRIFIVVFGIAFAQLASAGMMVEPFLGVSSGSLTGTTLAGATLTPTDHSMFGLGSRLGYRWGGFWTGLEASYFTGTGKAGSSSYDMTDTNIGLMFGYDMTNKYRLSAGYMFTSDLTGKDSSGQTTYKGSAIKFGIGYFFQPKWTFNVDMLMHSFSKASSGSTELAISDVYGSLKDNILSISFGYVL